MYAREPVYKIPHSEAAQDILHTSTKCLADFYKAHYIRIMKRGEPGERK
jgi:ribulose bisphosphate carboxylase small subunit